MPQATLPKNLSCILRSLHAEKGGCKSQHRGDGQYGQEETYIRLCNNHIIGYQLNSQTFAQQPFLRASEFLALTMRMNGRMAADLSL